MQGFTYHLFTTSVKLPLNNIQEFETRKMMHPSFGFLIKKEIKVWLGWLTATESKE